MHIVIEGRVYRQAALDAVTITDIIAIEKELRDEGLGVQTWDEVLEIGASFGVLSPSEAQAHPRKWLLMAVLVWASRRADGEKLSLMAAADVPLAAVQFIADPDDKPRTGPPAGKARGGSGRAGGPRPAAAKKASKSR